MLIGYGNIIQISDFGASKNISDKSTVMSFKGTIGKYVIPLKKHNFSYNDCYYFILKHGWHQKLYGMKHVQKRLTFIPLVYVYGNYLHVKLLSKILTRVQSCGQLVITNFN